MALDTLPDVKIEITSKPDVQPRVLETKFGDGYRQRAADGINTLEVVWNVEWPNITSAQADSLEAFFEAKAGWQAFLWTPRRKSAPWVWTCNKWSRMPDVGDLTDMTATFRREFDLQ